MPDSSRSKRVLIYSHDSFGLGHVSRCRTIANAIVEADKSVSVLIISGSPMIGSYEFRSGIDFVRVPGVVKQIDTGEYNSANLRVGVEHTLEMRTRSSATPPTSIAPTCSSSTRSRSACAARSCRRSGC